MFARLTLFVPIHTKSKPTTIIRSRLLRWQRGEFEGLCTELHECEEAFAKRIVELGPMDDETREKKVYKQVDVGEVSRARQTAMPSAPFSGDGEVLLERLAVKVDDVIPGPQRRLVHAALAIRVGVLEHAPFRAHMHAPRMQM